MNRRDVICPKCHADVLEAVTVSGVTLVLEVDASPHGTIALHSAGATTVAAPLTRNQQAAMKAAGVPVYELHSGNCIGKGRK